MRGVGDPSGYQGNDVLNHPSPPRDPDSLRQRAEKMARDDPRPQGELTAEQARELVDELRVYQAELEIQNEELHQAHEELGLARDRYRTLYDSAPAGYMSTHRNGRILEANDTATTMLGVARDKLLRRHLYAFVAKADQGAFFAHRRALFASGEHQTCEIRLLRGDGSRFEAHLHSAPLIADGGGITGYRTVISDITSRRGAERGWRLADAVVEASVEGIVVLDPQYRILRVNRAFTRLTGFRQADVRCDPIRALVADAGDRDTLDALPPTLERDGAWSGELWLRRQGAEPFPAKVSMAVLRDGLRRITHFALLFEDVTEARRAAEQLHHSAYYDIITGLPNRAMFMEHLAQHAKQAQRSGELLGMLFLDLNRFKQVNDNLGHSTGDVLLRRVGERIAGCVRGSDIVARIGGDEFAILLPAIGDGHGAAHIAEEIHAALATPVDVGATRVLSSASIGIALYPSDTDNLETLYRFADLAMYRAKDAPRGAHRFFDPAMNAHAMEHAGLERELDCAVEEDQFLLHFQPIVAMADGAIVGAEALLRWRHPRLGLLAPSSSPFLRVAEETGQIGPIGSWVLRSACGAAAGWNRGGEQVPYVSINVSPRQLLDTDSFQAIVAEVKGGGLPAARIAIGVTEHTAVRTDGIAAERLGTLRELGMHLAMDDFGTGYSSLSYLRGLPFDILKIDHSFINDFETFPDSAHLVEAIISMAHALGLKVVAEGVETQAQLDFLRERDCDFVQGHLLSPPLPQAGFEALIGRPRAVP